jgi:hypothetical protein
MTTSDDSNYQAQTVDISEDSKANAFEQTETVESMSELLTEDNKNKDTSGSNTDEKA